MKKDEVIVFFLLFTGFIYAQVGINITNPSCTLDILSRAENTSVDGILIPRLTREELTAKGDGMYNANHNGVMIYIANSDGGDALTQRVNIDDVGFYTFDSPSNVWKKVNMDPWRIAGETKQPSYHYQDIYQNANVAIGDYSTMAPTAKLDVNGNIRIRYMQDGKLRTNYPYNVVAKADGTLGASRGSYNVWRKAFNNTEAVMTDDDDILNVFSRNVTTIALPPNPKLGRVITIRIDGDPAATYTIATPTVTPVGYLPTNYTVDQVVGVVTAADYKTTIRPKTAIELVWTGAYGSGGLGWVQTGGDSQITP